MKDDGGKDLVYESLVQVARSALGRIDQFDYEPTAILVPLVVLDAPLVTVGWDSTSRQFRSTEAPHLELRWRGAPGWPYPTMTVHVATKDGLDRAVKYLWSMGAPWLAMVEALRGP